MNRDEFKFALERFRHNPKFESIINREDLHVGDLVCYGVEVYCGIVPSETNIEKLIENSFVSSTDRHKAIGVVTRISDNEFTWFAKLGFWDMISKNNIEGSWNSNYYGGYWAFNNRSGYMLRLIIPKRTNIKYSFNWGIK